ncbi:hypothetical protein FACS1894110_17180 [Spirochaetia bacterium]|nr:hypothetical protein FACS1894110_17180 [Spirochaetia bacterium]
MSIPKNKLSIDITYDFRTDSPPLEDPDRYSETLKEYHKRLWDKPLPNGQDFHLDDEDDGCNHLYHNSDLGEYRLSSDTMINTFYGLTWMGINNITEQIPENDYEEFVHISNTIGNRILFPHNKINGKSTINVQRWNDENIKDRFDLTLECIRRYYKGIDSPLEDTIQRYDNFFKLFTDFKGYCEFFLLQDFVSDGYSSIKYILPFTDFDINPLPTTLDQFLLYKSNSIEFINNRNKRIQDYIIQNQK